MARYRELTREDRSDMLANLRAHPTRTAGATATDQAS
jgi:hypothetical protein